MGSDVETIAAATNAEFEALPEFLPNAGLDAGSAPTPAEPLAEVDKFLEEGFSSAEPVVETETEPDAAEPAAEPNTTTPGFPAALVQRARESGFDEHDLASFTGASELERALNVLDRNLGRAALAAARNTPAAPASPAAGRTNGAAARNAAPPPSSAAPFGAERFRIPLTEEARETLDETLVQSLDAMNAHYAERIERAEAAIVQMVQQFVPVAQKLHLSEFDRLVSEAPDEYRDLLGSAMSEDLDAASAEFKNRVKVAQDMELLHAAAGRRPGRPPSARTLFQRALSNVFGDVTQGAAKKKADQQAADKLREQSRRVLARPTQRTGNASSGLSPDERARRTVHDKLVEFGVKRA
jgi:hypothetical protein